MKTIVVVFFLLIASVSWGQTRFLVWTPPAFLEDGSAIPAEEALQYRVWGGANQENLTIRAIVSEPKVDLSQLSLATGDLIAIEVFSTARVGIQTPLKDINIFDFSASSMKVVIELVIP